MSQSIVAIVAHPDDEVLGVAGTLARHAEDGDDVHILILADGESSRDTLDDLSCAIQARQDQANRVAQILGAKSVQTLSLPDNQMDTLARLEIAKIVEQFIQSVSGEVVYTHHSGDVNIDHRRAHEAVIIAARSFPGQSVRELFFFETASATEWQSPASFAPGFSPNVFVDVSSVWDKKVAAIEVYREEMRDFPHPRSDEALTALAKWRGSIAGVSKAEAFMLGRSIR
jgi:LmbE family N-acetylglucosaminyl deacetylase